VGDATTGEIFSAWEPELSVPIASTTKLMSFAVIMDAVTDGEISLADKVKITEEAEQLSRTADGMINLQTGTEVTLTELLCGMLLRSSNECALALAIHTAGSEAAFVERMNRKARVLGLSDGAVFYNCHGLPVYTDNLAATKIQNRMSAADMFRLVAYMLRAYPDLTRITSMKSVYLESLDITVSNSNTLLYNLPNTVGLKTGTTNMSGSCLVAAVEAEDAEGNPHVLVSVEFGAEDSGTRNTFSEELLRYGMQCLREGGAAARPAAPPADTEALIRAVLESF
jgi:D-alanyl-D-alanine carboxypeptidase